MVDWINTEGIDNRLMQLVKERTPTSKIATILSKEYHTDVTRNAAIGRAHRLGLDISKSMPNVVKKKSMTPLRIKRPKPAVSTDPISILKLSDRVCRYPLGPMIQDPPFLYCGRSTGDNPPYCPMHSKISFHPARAKWD